MKIFFPFFLVTVTSPSGQALASAAPNSGDGGLAVILLLGFIGIIIVGQLIPGVKLFFTILKGLFKKNPSQVNTANNR